MEKIDSILKTISARSGRPPENEEVLREYFRESLEKKKPITFYNWECPPRILRTDKDGNIFLDYSVDLEKIFRGKKLDRYTELPRIVAERKRELEMLKLLKSLELEFRFFKIIADTNAYYITPLSLETLGRKKIKEVFFDFRSRIATILKKDYMTFRPRSILFTELIKENRKEYERAFRKALKTLDSDPLLLLDAKTWKKETDYLKKHVGLGKLAEEDVAAFAKKVVATYAAEGMIFAKLSGTKTFSNCVWLNIEEPGPEAVEITDCLRRKEGLDKLPMIFPK